MISDRELLQVYIKPFGGMKNPNLYVELATSSSGSSNVILLEDGFDILLEDGVSKLLFES